MKWDMNGYIKFLDSTDRSVFHRSQPATWADPFWPHKSVDTSIDAALTDEEIEDEMSWLDVYDPAFEEDLNVLPDSSTPATEEDFGFTTESNKATWSTSTSTLRNLIKQRELP